MSGDITGLYSNTIYELKAAPLPTSANINGCGNPVKANNDIPITREIRPLFTTALKF